MGIQRALIGAVLFVGFVEAARFRRQAPRADVPQARPGPHFQRNPAAIPPSLPQQQSQQFAPQLGFPTSGFVPQFGAQAPPRFAQPPQFQGSPSTFAQASPPQFVGIQPQQAIAPASFVNPQIPSGRAPSAPIIPSAIPPPSTAADFAKVEPTKSEGIPSSNATEGIASNATTTNANATTTAATPINQPPVDKGVDLDGDGALSLAEVQYAAFVHHGLSSSVVEALFNQVDKNKDGYLTAAEFNDIRPLVLAKAENAALRYLMNVDTDRNQLLSLSEAQAYILKEYGISNRDVERIWRLVVPSTNDEMDAVLFSKLRRRVRGMSIRLARQIMKTADIDEDGRIDLREAQMIAFEQEGIGAGDVVEMLASVDDNNDGELNAPEFADFERIVRARSVDTAKKALKVVDTDGSGTLTMNEAKKIAFDHYGFDERTLEPFFAQADENEDGQLDAVEFAGFRSVIRSRAVKNAQAVLGEYDNDGDGRVSGAEAESKASRDDDLETRETNALFNVADQDRSSYLDKVELADFIRLVRLSAIKYVNDHFRDFDTNRDKRVTVDELETIVEDKYKVDPTITRHLFGKVDVDSSADLSAGEIVDFRHEVRKYVADRNAQDELDSQHKQELAAIEEKLSSEKATEAKHRDEPKAENSDGEEVATTDATSNASSANESDDGSVKEPADTKESKEQTEIEAEAKTNAAALAETTTPTLKTVKKNKAKFSETEAAPASAAAESDAPAEETTKKAAESTTTTSAPAPAKGDSEKKPENDEEFELVEVEEEGGAAETTPATTTTTTTTTTSPMKKRRVIKVRRPKTTTAAPTTTTEAPLGSQEEFVEIEEEVTDEPKASAA